MGSDSGIYYDNNTATGNVLISCEMDRMGETGTISSIDISGSILSVSKNVFTDNVFLSLTIDKTASKNQFVDDTLYITDLDPVGEFKVVSNTVKSASNELVVEIDQKYNTQWDSFVGKKIKNKI